MMPSRVGVAVLTGLALLPLGSAEGQPGTGDSSLRGLRGYSVQAVLGSPYLAQKARVELGALRGALETRLSEAGLLVTPCCGDAQAGIVQINVSLVGPRSDLFAWHLDLAVQQGARLQRDPEARQVVAVSWNRTAIGLDPIAEVRPAIDKAFDSLVSELLRAHAKAAAPAR